METKINLMPAHICYSSIDPSEGTADIIAEAGFDIPQPYAWDVGHWTQPIVAVLPHIFHAQIDPDAALPNIPDIYDGEDYIYRLQVGANRRLYLVRVNHDAPFSLEIPYYNYGRYVDDVDHCLMPYVGQLSRSGHKELAAEMKRYYDFRAPAPPSLDGKIDDCNRF